MNTTMLFVLTIIVTSLLVYPGQSQSPAAAPMVPLTPGPSGSTLGPTAAGPAAADCTTLLYGLIDCLDFVTKGSNQTKPPKACCGELKSLVDTNPQCLCELLANSSTSAAFGVDINRATKLPSLCKVKTPPVSACSLFGYPVGVPTPSEAPSSAEDTSSGGMSPAGSSISPSQSPNSGGRASVNSLLFSIAALVGFAISFF